MIELPKWASKVTFDMLPDAHKKLAEMIGVEATLRLCAGLGGSNPYIPFIDSVRSVARNKIICKSFLNGESVAKLAVQYRLTERSIQRIVEKYR